MGEHKADSLHHGSFLTHWVPCSCSQRAYPTEGICPVEGGSSCRGLLLPHIPKVSSESSLERGHRASEIMQARERVGWPDPDAKTDSSDNSRRPGLRISEAPQLRLRPAPLTPRLPSWGEYFGVSLFPQNVACRKSAGLLDLDFPICKVGTVLPTAG